MPSVAEVVWMGVQGRPQEECCFVAVVPCREQALLTQQQCTSPWRKACWAQLCPCVWGQPHPRLLPPSGAFLRGTCLTHGCALSSIWTHFPSPENGFRLLRPLPSGCSSSFHQQRSAGLSARCTICTDSPWDRLSDSSDPKGRHAYIFSSLLFFKGKGEFFLNPNHFWLFLLLLFLRCFVCF